jgi:hypothetical protein
MPFYHHPRSYVSKVVSTRRAKPHEKKKQAEQPHEDKRRKEHLRERFIKNKDL